MRAALIASVLLLGTAPVAACSDGGRSGKPPAAVSPAPVPSGFTPVRADRIVLAHPAPWKAGAPPAGWTFVAEQQAAERRADADASARVGVIRDVPQVNDPEILAAGSTAALQLHARGFARGPYRPVSVPGAARALRFDYTYEDGAPARGTELAVVLPGGSAAVVRIAGLRTALSPELVDQIVRTVAVRP